MADETEITEVVSFGCSSCGGDNLKSVGAGKTRGNRIFLIFKCEGCGTQFPIEVDKVIAELYKKILVKGSKGVN